MDTSEFLARVIPQAGNYASVGWFNTHNGHRYFNLRSWPTGDLTDAVKTIGYWSGKGHDVYHALGSFVVGETKTTKQGRQYTEAPRTQANVHSLKVLVIDCDVAHAATKVAARAYPTRAAALAWIKSFTAATGLPRPNITVDSGNGFHFYWALQDAIPVAQWQPLAEAMKAAMLQHKFISDVGCTVDAARILRPPGSINVKSGAALPVTVIDALTLPDYLNAAVVTALVPYMGARSGNRLTVLAGTMAAAAGSSVSGLGPRPAELPPGDLSINQAAGQRERPAYKFALAARRCEQLKRTVADHGADQSYEHWRLGDLTLAAHCTDGDEWVHPISDGYAGYDAAQTDKAFADAQARVEADNIGPPLCGSYDTYRPGVCDSCPFRGKIKTPLSLGIEDYDLPAGYRRAPFPLRAIQRRKGTGEDATWEPLLVGDVSDPRCLELREGGHELQFTYKLNLEYPVGIRSTAIGNGVEFAAHLARAGITVAAHLAPAVGVFVVAWINKLRDLGQVEYDAVSRPFGWNYSGDKLRGLAIAGDLYTQGGTVVRLACPDRKLASTYTPKGTYEAWRAAAALFEGRRPDLQALLACSFGAPLVALTSDVRGMTLNFWSTSSGIGKTTVIKVGQSVWGDYAGMSSMDDTANAAMKTLAGPRVLVRYWDEFRVPKERHAEFVRLIYTLPQGREKQRMNGDSTLREVGEWETLMPLASNRPLADVLASQTDGTDSGLLRLLDVPLDKQQMVFDPTAGLRIKAVESNFGHAGRKYAGYLGANGHGVRTYLADMLGIIVRDIGLLQEERYYATAMATIVTGAIIAKKLELFDFDIGGVYDVLRRAVLDARIVRGTQIAVTANGKFDIVALLAGYLNARGNQRLRTDVLGRVGGGPVRIIQWPKLDNVTTQIAQSGTIRIHRNDFWAWLDAQNLSASLVTDQMVTDWGAKDHRGTLGIGTQYGTGRLAVLDIPRGDPSLESCFDAGSLTP